MLEPIVEFLTGVPWYWVLVIAFGVTLIENIFPPSPSDSVLVFTGSLVSLGTVGFPELLISSTAGSVAGFIIMFILGSKFDRRFVRSKKLKYINPESIEKVENWFKKYGYKLIVANRFLSGTRAVIAFFAGMSGLDLKKTIILSAISATIWNTLLILLGSLFGNNWQEIQEYMDLYGKIIFPIIIAIILFFAIRWYILNRKQSKNKKAD